jgi:peptidyl-prolyl cis-trans isomerase B (cyclophilin B)
MRLRNILILAVVAIFGLAACNNQQTEKKEGDKPQVNKEVKSKQVSAPEKTEAEPDQKVAKGQKAKISTKFGDIIIVLYDETPIHRDNFIKLVGNGYYDGTLFHRVMRNFMIQGGDPNSVGATPDQRLGNGGPGYTLEAEILPEFIHKKGALAAARQGDQVNPERRSSGSQFYIVQGQPVNAQQLNQMSQRTGAFYTADQIETYKKLGGTPFLDNQYTVFGEVVKGLEVVDMIAAVKTKPGDRPVEDVEMTITLID